MLGAPAGVCSDGTCGARQVRVSGAVAAGIERAERAAAEEAGAVAVPALLLAVAVARAEAVGHVGVRVADVLALRDLREELVVGGDRLTLERRTDRVQELVQFVGVEEDAARAAHVQLDAVLVDLAHGLAVNGAIDGVLRH